MTTDAAMVRIREVLNLPPESSVPEVVEHLEMLPSVLAQMNEIIANLNETLDRIGAPQKRPLAERLAWIEGRLSRGSWH